ncbi:MAG: sugar porter family MFS transporter [Planctomycetota bacterium]
MAKRSYLLGMTIIAALGGLLFGFDTAVISGTERRIQDLYQLDRFWLGFTVASALIGTIVGSMAAGRPADLLGRRTALLWIAALYFVSAVGCAFAWDWYSLVFFRCIGGLSVGGSSVVSPMYIAEISPARHRGRLVAITQFNIVLGILLAFFSNYIIAELELGDAEWRWMFGVEAFPAAAFFALLFLTPQSPRWLVARGRKGEAHAVLVALGEDAASAGERVREIEASLETGERSEEDRFFSRRYRKPILLAVAIAAFNQFSGINAILYYAPRIFEMAGSEKAAALLQAVVVGGTNLVFTMLALSVIDRFGRRKLMLAGSIGYILSLSATAASFYAFSVKKPPEAVETNLEAPDAMTRGPAPPAPEHGEGAKDAAEPETRLTRAGQILVLVSLLVFIASHAFGQGAVIWVFVSEIFPNRVRARGQALGSFTHWAMCALISWTFPIIAEVSGGHAFAFYAAMMVLQLLWVLCVMPETKGVPLEEIEKKLGIR